MNSDNFFRTSDEELVRLNRELAETRELLRDGLARLNQIERHLKRAFGGKVNSTKEHPKPRELGSEHPAISPEEALDLFRELTDLSREKGSLAVEDSLERMTIADLKLMARELGISFSSKPARRNLHAGIRGRISESVMLSQNRNVTAPISEQKTTSDRQQPEEPLADETDRE